MELYKKMRWVNGALVEVSRRPIDPWQRWIIYRLLRRWAVIRTQNEANGPNKKYWMTV